MATHVKYRWFDFFGNAWVDTPCEVLSHTDKTAKIKLLGCGKNNALPGTVIRVHIKSLVGFGIHREEDIERWKKTTYFD